MQILIVISKSDKKGPSVEGEWKSLVVELKDETKGNIEIERLNENLFLLRGESALPFLGFAVSAANKAGFPCRVLFVEKMTEWKGPNNPME